MQIAPEVVTEPENYTVRCATCTRTALVGSVTMAYCVLLQVARV